MAATVPWLLGAIKMSSLTFFSFAFYVVTDIVGPNIIRPATSDATYPWVEQLVRVLLNVQGANFNSVRPL